MSARVPVQPHLYVGDGIKDHTGADRCENCRMPKVNVRHMVPEVPDDVRHAEVRRMGEGTRD